MVMKRQLGCKQSTLRLIAGARLTSGGGALVMLCGLLLMLLIQSGPVLVASKRINEPHSSYSVSRELLQATGSATGSMGGNATGPGVSNVTETPGPPGVITARATLPGDVAAVRSCLPFNILILPGSASGGGGGGGSTNASNVTGAPGGAGNMTTSNMTWGMGNGGTASIIMQAEAGVINATDITYLESDGILSLALAQGYSTSHVINLTLYTANRTSLRFVQNFGPGNLVVGPGFSVETFAAAAASLGGILVKGLTADHAYVTNTGLATVALNGTFRDVDVVAGGTSKVYLAGNTSRTVSVSADGISTTWVQGSPGTQITGTASGLAKVLYTEGTCTVEPAFKSIFGVSIFGDPCQRLSPGTGPTFIPRWSCGQEVQGRSVCPEVRVGASSDVGLGSGTAAGRASSTTPSTTTTAGNGNGNTVSGAPGTVTTGTFTTPGGTSSASGTVSGPGGTIGGQLTAAGGNPPSFAASFNPTPDFFSPALVSGLDPDFTGFGRSASGGGGMGTSSSSVGSGGGGGNVVTSTSFGSGSQSALSTALNIPSTSSGLAIRSAACVDSESSRAMIPSGGDY